MNWLRGVLEVWRRLRVQRKHRRDAEDLVRDMEMLARLQRERRERMEGRDK